MDGIWLVGSISLFMALLVSAPILITQIWKFIVPGLTLYESKGIRLIFTVGTVLFLIGASIAYYWAVPFGLGWLIAFNTSLEGMDNVWRGAEYLSFLFMCIFGFGLAFETPLIMLGLAKIGILTTDVLKKNWRFVIMSVTIVAAIITPPDPITMIMMGVLLGGLLWVGYLLVYFAERQDRPEEIAEDEPESAKK